MDRDQKIVDAKSDQRRSADYKNRRPQPDDVKSKGSQMSVSISIQNQSMRDLGVARPVISSEASNSMILKDKYSNDNHPVDLAILDKELAEEERKRQEKADQEALSKQTLSMSADQMPSALNAIDPNTQLGSKDLSGKELSGEDENSSNDQDQDNVIDRQMQSQYTTNINPHIDDSRNKMFDIDMTAKDSTDANGRPYSQLAARPYENSGKQKDVRIRKKRVKSTKPGGIRGGVLIQDRFCAQTPQNNRKKSKNYSLKKLTYNEQHSLAGGQSTKAGLSSTNNQSSMLYNSYAPTSLVKIGTRSVQRLRPRLPESYKSTGTVVRPTTAVVQPFQTQGNLASEYTTTLNNTVMQSVPSQRPYSHKSNKHPRNNKLASMKAAMSNSNAIMMNQQFTSIQTQNTQGKIDTNSVDEKSNHLKTFNGNDLAESKSLLENQDGFKLVSQFENEQQAMEYATELQKYYNGLNMDVKVQIESDLEQLDDSADQSYIAEAQQQKEESTRQSQIRITEEEEAYQSSRLYDHKRVIRKNVKNAFESHFTKTNQVQQRPAFKSLKDKKEQMTTNFEKRVDKRPMSKEQIKYDKLNKQQIKEVYEAQEQIYGVIKDTALLPELSYQNVGAIHRQERDPYFKFDQETIATQLRSKANFQAQILRKLGLKANDLRGEIPHASQVMSCDGKIPKSRAKFHQREQRFKKQFQAKCEQWQQEEQAQNVTIHDTLGSSVQQISGQQAQDQFDVDVRLYKERGDNYCIIGNKVQYRASEQNQPGFNYVNKQAMDTKGSFDPIRIRLRIMPISRAPLAQGKTPDYYFIEAAKKSLSGDLTSAIESLKRGLLINPHHYICRFNHGVLMFKFGLIREATRDFEELKDHPHGMKDPWVFYNLATCLIQTGYPEKESAFQARQQQAEVKAINSAKNQQKESSLMQFGGLANTETFNKINQKVVGTLARLNVKQDKGTKNYETAIELCDRAYQLGGSDMQIMIDAQKLKGICQFRLGKLIDSVSSLYKAKTIENRLADEVESRRLARMKQEEEDEIIGYFTRKDLLMVKRLSKRSKSFLHKRHIRIRPPEKKDMRRDHSWCTYEQMENKVQIEQEPELSNTSDLGRYESSADANSSSSSSVRKSNKLSSINGPMSSSEQSKADYALAMTKHLIESELDSNSNTDARSRKIALLQEPQSVQRSGQASPDINRKSVSRVKTRRNSNSKDLLIEENNTQGSKARLGSASNLKESAEKTIRFDLPNGKQKNTEQKLKQGLTHGMLRKINQVAKKMHEPRLMNNNKISDLMKKMKMQQAQLAEDRHNLHLSKAQYAIFRRTYIDERKKSDAKVNEENPLLRLKNLYLREFADDETEFEDCNAQEKNELLKRKEIEKWLSDDLISRLIEDAAKKLNKMGEQGVDSVDDEFNTRFVKQLLEVAAVNQEEVDGTHCENLVDIIGDQSQMDDIMIELRDKVSEMCRQFENELKRGKQELHAIAPKLDEMKILRGEKHTAVEDEQLGIEDKMITRLRDALHNDNQTPDEVINVLTTDNFEKEKVKLTLQYMNGGSDDEELDEEKVFIRRKLIAPRNNNKNKESQEMRYTERHIEQIRSQYAKKHGDRNYKVLDVMMRHLRFIKRHDKDVRYRIFKHAEFVEIPARTVIFNKGEVADYMYIILKGRISCESNISMYDDIPIILATAKDGEAVGELAIIDNEALRNKDDKDDKKDSKLLSTGKNSKAQLDDIGENFLQEQVEEKVDNQRKRMATCRTVEQTRMLRILAIEAKKIVQPTLKREQDCSISAGPSTLQHKHSQELKSVDSVQNSGENVPSSEPIDYAKDELNNRVQFLMNFSLFKGVPKEVLMPVAVNMTVVKFSYGEFLTRQGEVPAGMYIIRSGQCIVGLSRLAERVKNYRQIPGQRQQIIDKYSLFNKFDPENSLLNNVEMQDRVFQNQRIYVENDQQIRDKILYKDFVQFSKLFPMRQFGGRRLLPFELYMQLKRIYFGAESLKKPDNEASGDIRVEEKYQMKSFLDIVADSACVEAYLITKQGIQYLSEKYLTTIYEDIVQEKEPDRPLNQQKINEKKEEMIQSQEETLVTVKNLMREHKIEKYGVNALKQGGK